MLPKISGPKLIKLKPVLTAKVYQNMLNKAIMEIAQKIKPHQKILVFSPSNMAFQPLLGYKKYKNH